MTADDSLYHSASPQVTPRTSDATGATSQGARRTRTRAEIIRSLSPSLTNNKRTTSMALVTASVAMSYHGTHFAIALSVHPLDRWSLVHLLAHLLGVVSSEAVVEAAAAVEVAAAAMKSLYPQLWQWVRPEARHSQQRRVPALPVGRAFENLRECVQSASVHHP